MYLTRAIVEKTIHFGDGIAVEYINSNGVAVALRWFEGGRASHFLECYGGLDLFEETIGGGMATRLNTYLKGNCNLTLLRAPRPITDGGRTRIRSYWMSLEGTGYGWDSVKRSAVTVPIRRFVRPHFPILANAMTDMARTLLPGDMPDCSAAWVDGIRLDQPVMTG